MLDADRWYKTGFNFMLDGMEYTKPENCWEYETNGVLNEVLPEDDAIYLACPILIMTLIDLEAGRATLPMWTVDR